MLRQWIKMRLSWKRNILGNLVALSLCCSLLAGYITLLRYNKASGTTFNLVSKRRSHRVIREVDSGHAAWKSGHFGNHQMKPGKKDTKRWRQSPLEVFIVEEHHEVNPVWWNAVTSGVISHHGNTLVHIDGHNDFAVPFLVPGYPFFRMPKDAKEKNGMMQRNDVFIMQAVMAGFIKRIIWIWPEWDKKNHIGPHEKAVGEIGFAHVTTGEALREKVFCICMTNSTKYKECHYTSEHVVSSQDKDPTHSLKPKQCSIRRTVAVESVREDIAVTKFKEKSWLTDHEKIMLDIDEDFYGCTYASQPLLNAGVKLDTLLKMNSIMNQLFCPKSLEEERGTDRMLIKLLEIFVKHNSKCLDRHGKRSHTCKNDTQKSLVVPMLKSFLWDRRGVLACSKKSRETENLVMQLVELFLSQLNPKQIKALQYVGFCLSTTLNSYISITDPTFGICMGNNNPKETAVDTHKPTRSEIAHRTTTLGRILGTLTGTRTPQLVTICRSMRDGYTPRGFFKQIERDIIKTVNTSFPQARFHYDVGLLGGRKGWPDRTKSLKYI